MILMAPAFASSRQPCQILEIEFETRSSQVPITPPSCKQDNNPIGAQKRISKKELAGVSMELD
jgi:hypothetical protein